MRSTPNDQTATDPPTPDEAAAELVEMAPIGHRAVVYAHHPRGDSTGWELVNPASIVIEDDRGDVRTLHPRTGEIEQLWTWDEYLAELDRWIAAAPSSAPGSGPAPGVPETVVGDVEDP
jgi:hypothetical protein